MSEAAEQEENAPFDWDEAARMIGATTQQTLFAKARLKGMNATRAAEAAGYKGKDEQLRSAGYRCEHSPKVKSLIAWAQREGAGISDKPCESDELKKILSRRARGADANSSIRAVEVLHRIELADAEIARASDPTATPEWVLDAMASIAPEIAALIAKRFGVTWEWKADARHNGANGSAMPNTEAARTAGAKEQLRAVVAGQPIDADGARETNTDHQRKPWAASA